MKITLGLFTLLLISTTGLSGEWFATPDGAGKNDGTAWENAVSGAELESTINSRMQPGDRLNLASGVYRQVALTLSTGGAPGRPKTITGVERDGRWPVFSGDWNVDKPAAGATAIRLAPGASHLHFEHLRLEKYAFGVLAPAVKEEARRADITFADVDIHQFRYGFYLSDIDDLRLRDCDLKRYTKHGFRLDQGCQRVTFQRCTADCSTGDAEWENKTEVFPFGFSVNDGGAGSADIAYEDCLAANNMKPNQTTRYKNGDGFVIEGNTRKVTLRRCRALRNQDGGFDLKVPEVKLNDCVAIGNKRGFRVWAGGELINCVSAWNSNAAFWTNGGELKFSRCTFVADQGIAMHADDKATGPLHLDACLIALSGSAVGQRGNSKVTFDNQKTIFTGPKQPGEDPKFVRPDPKWDGIGDALNSRTYPDVGYQQPPVDAAKP